jgi:hypothetical protein
MNLKATTLTYLAITEFRTQIAGAPSPSLVLENFGSSIKKDSWEMPIGAGAVARLRNCNKPLTARFWEVPGYYGKT